MSIFKNYFIKVATKMYILGKANFERKVIENLYKKGTVHTSVKFSMNADLQNLSDNNAAITIGKESNIEGLILVYPYGGKVSIGDYCSLSPNSRLVSTAEIKIGNRVLLDAVLRHQDFVESFSIGMQPHDLNAAPIIIEDDVWIGHNTTILKGVTIGRGAIIGSNSVVTKNIESYSVNVGNPLRVVQYLKEEKKIII
jgi:acetyltransferase-like isoleucine patch superfamily enzyme